MGAPAAQQTFIQASASIGQNIPSELFEFQQLSNALYSGVAQVPIPANTSNNAINPATLFPSTNTFALFGIQDITGGGQELAYGQDAGGARMPLAAGGMAMFVLNGLPPTIYIDNPSGSNVATVSVFMLGLAAGGGWTPAIAGLFAINNITGPYTGNALGQNAYICDPTAGSIVLTLGDAATYIGDEAIIYLTGAPGSNTLTINPPAGGTINGSSNPIVINTTNAEYRFLAVSATNWIYAQVGV